MNRWYGWMSSVIAVSLTAVVALGAGCGRSKSPAPAPGAASPTAAAPANPAPAAPAAAPTGVPADADNAKAALDKSPRHGEWVDLPLPDGKKLSSWVVYPEVKDKAGVVIVIHEIFGLSDWIRGVADAMAAQGFIAIAPDMLSGMGPDGGGTASLGENVGTTIRALPPETVIARIDAARAYALTLPAANGKVGTMGFCWGGAASFNYAVAQPKLDAAVVYYGTSPSDLTAYPKINAPVLGLYGSDDARVNATIPTAEAEMTRAGKRFTPVIYEGAGHGFLRQLTQREGKNQAAADQAWPTTVAFFREHLK
jgi:carboxymethylenebutenolidase